MGGGMEIRRTVVMPSNVYAWNIFFHYSWKWNKETDFQLVRSEVLMVVSMKMGCLVGRCTMQCGKYCLHYHGDGATSRTTATFRLSADVEILAVPIYR
jgi:hypothetical protein